MMMTKAMLASDGADEKKRLSAGMPPAEAPIPTIGKTGRFSPLRAPFGMAFPCVTPR